MSSKRSKTGLILAALNVGALVVLLAPKPPEFDWLRAKDAAEAAAKARGEVTFLDFDAPLYVAGRPLSGGDIRVSFAEHAYVFLNFPAIMASLAFAWPLTSASATWAAAHLTPSEWKSWVLAGTLVISVAGWAFTLGVLFDRWRRTATRAA